MTMEQDFETNKKHTAPAKLNLMIIIENKSLTCWIV